MGSQASASAAARLAREHFGPLAAAHGATALAVGYSEASQDKRFRALTRLGDLDGATVLDLGCGWGMLLHWLTRSGVFPRYTGVDVVPAMLGLAWQRLGAHLDLRCLDILNEPLDGQWDYVIVNGTLNLHDGENWGEMLALMHIAWRLARRGLAITFSSSWAPNIGTEPLIYHYSPDRMLDAARGCTRRALLDHSYLPHDAALLMWREV